MDPYIIFDNTTNRDDVIEEIRKSIYVKRVEGRRVYRKETETVYESYYDSWERRTVTYPKYVTVQHRTDDIFVEGEKYIIPGVVSNPIFIAYTNDSGIINRHLIFTVRVADWWSVTESINNKRDEFINHYMKQFLDPMYASWIQLSGRRYTKWIDSSLDKSIGFGVETLQKNLQEYYDTKIDGKGYMNSDERKRWLTLNSESRLHVVGLDRRFIDIFPTGFSVRLLLRTSNSFDDQKKFIQGNRKDILKYVMNEIQYSKKIMKKIGDLKFYKPVEIILLRTNEVDIKFEVKGESMDVGA